MADPQVEHGHTRIANEIMDQLARLRISGNKFNLVMAVLRRTYGFHKKTERITGVQLVEATGLLKSVVSRAMKELKGQGILTTNGKTVGLQKDYELWKVSNPATFDSSGASKVSKPATSEKLAIPQLELAKAEQKVSKPATSDTPSPPYPPNPVIKIKDTIKRYGEFKNVLLTDEDYQKLTDKVTEPKAKDLIERLSAYMKSKGKRYKDHYATLLNWHRRDSDGKSNKGKLPDRSKYTRVEYDED